MAQIIRYLVPTKVSTVKYVREPAYSNDTFSTIWLRIFRQLKFSFQENGEMREYNLAELYSNGVTQGDVKREVDMSFSLNDVPIIVIDEFNVVRDDSVAIQMSETVKALSDDGVNVTVIIVGVSDNVSDLVRGHQSIIRCSEEVLMPRMARQEMLDLLESRISKLGMKIEGDAKWKIINLSKGLPSFTHTLGRDAALAAIGGKRLLVKESDVDAAIESLLVSSQNTLKDDYDNATRSNQDKARFKQILTACALAKSDEGGYFTSKQVQQPLSTILGRQVGIDDFNKNLREFTTAKRGSILQDKGTERFYRYRFRNPAMQPFAIMKGIKEAFLDEKAKLALSSPEQPDLFSSD